MLLFDFFKIDFFVDDVPDQGLEWVRDAGKVGHYFGRAYIYNFVEPDDQAAFVFGFEWDFDGDILCQYFGAVFLRDACYIFKSVPLLRCQYGSVG